MNFLDKLQRKFGKYAISNLMQYMLAVYAVGVVLGMINPNIYYAYLSLDISMVLKGQVWRLVTFIFQPMYLDFFLLISIYLYYMIGNSLERAWGAFRFNLYFFSGILFQILAAIILYAITGMNTSLFFANSLDYINQTLFFAFAAVYPNMQMMLFFVIPIKIKYLAWIYGIIFAYDVVRYAINGVWVLVIVMLLAVANFIIFFLATRNYRKISPKEYKRRANYKRQVRNAYNPDNVVQFRGKTTITRHKCSVCGRTELDDENLEFRFCSKCDGNYEYCMDHLYTHEHVHKEHTEKES